MTQMLSIALPFPLIRKLIYWKYDRHRSLLYLLHLLQLRLRQLSYTPPISNMIDTDLYCICYTSYNYVYDNCRTLLLFQKTRKSG